MNQLLKSPRQPHQAEEEPGNTNLPHFLTLAVRQALRPLKERNLAPIDDHD